MSGEPGAPYTLTEDPPNAGVRLSDQDGRHLAQSQMYKRNNFAIPQHAPEGFAVRIPGHPERHFGIADLASYPLKTTSMVLECAGNGRTLMNPVPDGTPWGLGASSVIKVSGVALNEVLDDMDESVVDVVFTGADRGVVEPEGEVSYQFSLDRATALSPGPLLVTHIADEPLTQAHGAPVRLIVPGHYAMKSVKWLIGIEGLRKPFSGHFVNKYRYYSDSSEREGAPVGRIQVRSVISAPLEGSVIAPGPTVVKGSAWTGHGEIDRVDISVDEGDTWDAAALEPGESSLSAARWSITVDLSPDITSIISKATDSTGATQPMASRWNRNGYANNVAHRVSVTAG